MATVDLKAPAGLFRLTLDLRTNGLPRGDDGTGSMIMGAART
jgi:hypothetical protein